MLAFEQSCGLLEGRAPFPGLDDPRIAGLGHAACPEIGHDVDGVVVEEFRPALGLGKLEAVFHEGFGRDVEFAHDHRVGATPGKPDQAPLIVRRQAADVVPDPVFTLGFGQRVQVDEHFPLRFARAVFLERGAPPQAALVFGVPPEVVQMFTADGRVGNPVLGIVNSQVLFEERLELRQFFEHAQRFRVALPGPVQGLLALDFLEPQEGVFGFAGVSACAGQDNGHEHVYGFHSFGSMVNEVGRP